MSSSAQLEHYYMSAKGAYQHPSSAASYYEYLNVGSAAYPSAQVGPSASALLQPTAAAVVALGSSQQNAQHQVSQTQKTEKSKTFCKCLAFQWN